VREAQINYRHYFSSTEPDLFPRILQRFTDSQPNQVRAEDLLKRLRRIREQDQHARELGLATEQWDYEQLARFLEEQRASADITHALAVLSAYVEALESGAAERELLANKLRTFESLMSQFLEGKEVVIRPRQGFAILTNRGEELHESQLSSGEYHLLYLMVSALVTQRRGTVIAIDEPEMSMHIKWQRRLISALMKCASNAEPQFIFATHSPYIAAEFPDDMVMLALRE
jgi:predicted ATPase